MSNRGVKSRKIKLDKISATKTKTNKSFFGIVLGLATLFSVFVGIVTLRPSITVTASDPVDPNDPFTSTITVTNIGYVPLNSVGYNIALNKLITSVGGGFVAEREYGPILAPFSNHPQDLRQNEMFSFPLNDVFRINTDALGTADLAILIEYEIPVLHLRRGELYPIVARRQSNGRFYWYRKSPPKNFKAGPCRIGFSKPIPFPDKDHLPVPPALWALPDSEHCPN